MQLNNAQNKVLISEIIKRVRVILDEIGLDDARFNDTDVDTSNMDITIKSKIFEAICFVHKNAPAFRVDYMNATPSNVSWKEVRAGAGVWKVNFSVTGDHANVLRFLSMKLTGEQITCTTFCTEWDPLYIQQQDPNACGTSEHPVGVIRIEDTGYIVEYYSVDKQPTNENTATEFIRYVPYPDLSGDYVFISHALVNAVLYRVAALVASTYSDKNAQVLFDLSTSYMIS